jgi:hypothetical protein
MSQPYTVQKLLAALRDPASELREALGPVIADAMRQQGLPAQKHAKKRRRPLDAQDVRLRKARLVGSVMREQHLSLGDASVFVKTHGLAY